MQNKLITKPKAAFSTKLNLVWSKLWLWLSPLCFAMKTACIFLGILLSFLLLVNFCYAAEESVTEFQSGKGNLLLLFFGIFRFFNEKWFSAHIFYIYIYMPFAWVLRYSNTKERFETQITKLVEICFGWPYIIY